MQTYTSLYPPRNRSVNVELIKRLRDSRTQEEFEAADVQIGMNLHPSLFAELDWMEVSMPEEQRADGAKLADGLFFYHLPAIMDQRRVEFDLPQEELRWEILENLDFYRNLTSEDEQPFDVLGMELSQRIQSTVQSLEPDFKSVVLREIEAERAGIDEKFSGIEDPFWFPMLIEVEIRNALAKSLDHVSSRMQTKGFLRQIGGQLPRQEIDSISSEEELQPVLEWLKNLGDLAGKFLIYRLFAVCYLMRKALSGIDVTGLGAFSGQLGVGYGHCGACSMMFASSAIVSYDPTVPWLFQGDDDHIYLPFDFNVSVCPFCGVEARQDIPSMFYSPKRNQVIYNYPRLEQFTEDEAQSVYRPAVNSLREMFKSRISEAEARQFEMAGEEFTYNISDFLLAVQMGTTVSEEHVSLLIQFSPSESGIIMDPTKGATIAMTPAEMERQQLSGRAVTPDSFSYDVDMMKAALEAFSGGEFEKARDILESLHQEYPDNDVIRKNLATAYVTLGDIASAKRVTDGS